VHGQLDYTESAGLPSTAHNNLLPLTSCQPPLVDAVAKRFILYVQRCLASDCEIMVAYIIWPYGFPSCM